MSLFLILGMIMPVVYVIRLNILDNIMTIRRGFITIILSIIGIVTASSLGSIVTKQLNELIFIIIGAIITGVLWGLLLVGSYILINWLSKLIKK
ncbi:MAG: hypothetical protein KZY51_09230 [Staphylococcaceae bacterium]|nr:hypothetical protein [Staphylococcaceae bacterium]MBW4843491.1 hypothetical protein [Staphylococcaceae bacterium]